MRGFVPFAYPLTHAKGLEHMGIGASIALVAVGAVLTFAVDLSAVGVEVAGVDLDLVGVILMVTGGLGLLASTLIFGSRSAR